MTKNSDFNLCTLLCNYVMSSQANQKCSYEFRADGRDRLRITVSGIRSLEWGSEADGIRYSPVLCLGLVAQVESPVNHTT